MKSSSLSFSKESLKESLGRLELPHYTEWMDSHCSDDFIAANVRSLSGEEAFERIASSAQHRLERESNQAANSKLFRFNKRNSNLYAGGWWCSGLDPLADFEPMEWGQLKPTRPNWDGSKQRHRKYLAPFDEPTRLFLPAIPPSVARSIIERYNSTAPKDKRIEEKLIAGLEIEMLWEPDAFWQFFLKHPDLPLVVTEGAKKTGAICCAGFAAVGLPGVWNACKSWERDADGQVIPGQRGELKDEVLKFAQPGRKIIIAFDEDEKASTQQAVWAASARTAFYLLRDSKAQPHIASWSHEQGKGADDYIAANGADAFAELLTSAWSYEQWRIQGQLARALERKADLEICQPLLDIDFAVLPKDGIIGILSPKGSGKTQRFLLPLLANEQSALLVGHLINLTRANSRLMNFTYRSDLDRAAGRFIGPDGSPVYRVSTVVDSLLSFNPRDFEGAVIVIDEINQMLRSALTSKLISKRGNRGAILTRLRQIIQQARLVVVADADLSDWALTYLEELRGDDKPAYIIKNTFIPEGYPVTFYESSGADGIVDSALGAYRAELAKGSKGKHIVIATDSGKKAKVLAQMARQLEGAEVIEIHRDSSGGEFERAFVKNATAHLDEAKGPVFLVYSPSMGTGVSIESDRIAEVFGIFEGASITDTDILQMLGRVRANAPRSIWVKEKGSAYSKLSRSAQPEALKQALKIQADALAQTIRHSLTETAYSGLTGFTWNTDPHIQAWCEIESERNQSMPNLRARVAYRLQAEGNKILMRVGWESKPTAMALKVTRGQIETEEAIATEAAPEIGETMAQLISAKDNATAEERRQLNKYRLADFYLAEVTAALVLNDRNGSKRSEVKNFEEVMEPDLATNRDAAALEAQLKWGSDIMPQDIRTGSVSAEVRRLLGLHKWIEREDSWSADCRELAEFKELCLRERVKPSIKLALGYTVRADASPQKILSELLRQCGVKVKSDRKMFEGKSQRIYSIDADIKTELAALIERRSIKRSEAETAKEHGGQPRRI